MSRRPRAPISREITTGLRQRRETLEAREKVNDRRERRRRTLLAWIIGPPVVAAAVGLPILGNHIQHDARVAQFEQLDKEHAADRLALALPYRDPELKRVVDTHHVDQGRDTVDLTLSLPLSHKAAGIMAVAKERERANLPKIIDWLSPPGVVLYPVSQTAAGKPTIGKPHFMEEFQGRNAGTQIDEHSDIGTVAVTLPTSLPVGSEEAVFVSNKATSRRFGLDGIPRDENNDVRSEDQGQAYVATLHLVNDHGHRQWEAMAKPPQLPDMYGTVDQHVPAGPTHNP